MQHTDVLQIIHLGSYLRGCVLRGCIPNLASVPRIHISSQVKSDYKILQWFAETFIANLDKLYGRSSTTIGTFVLYRHDYIWHTDIIASGTQT